MIDGHTAAGHWCDNDFQYHSKTTFAADVGLQPLSKASEKLISKKENPVT
jgi:hypothetical protein